MLNVKQAEASERLAKAGIFEKFPKERPPLPADLSALFYDEYKDNRSGQSILRKLSLFLESWMHKKVARYAPKGPILELGAGTLNHLCYEKDVKEYDIVEPYTHWFSGSPELEKVRNVFDDIKEIDGTRFKYSRIISIAVLEHLTDLPRYLAQSALLLKKNGVFQAGIPTEGGFLWGLAWRMSTGLAFRLRTGKDYGMLMRHEHVNTDLEILELINCFFNSVEYERFPINKRHLSTYTYVSARGPKTELAEAFLKAGGEKEAT